MHRWPSITNFDDGRADHPREAADSTAKVIANLQEIKNDNHSKSGNSYLDKIAAEQKRIAPGTEFSWNEKDVALYSKHHLPDIVWN